MEEGGWECHLEGEEEVFNIIFIVIDIEYIALGGRGHGRGPIDEGPPAEIVGLYFLFIYKFSIYVILIYLEVGQFLHSAESEMVCRLTNVMIPFFNAGIYLENKAKVGRVEEVFGPINKVYFTIKPDAGVNASSFQLDDKVFIGTDKLLPLSRFTNEGKKGGGSRGGGRGGPGKFMPVARNCNVLHGVHRHAGGRGGRGGRSAGGRGGRALAGRGGGGFRGSSPGGRGGGGGRIFNRGSTARGRGGR